MRRLLLGLVAALVACPWAADAGALGVSPVGFEIPAGARAAILTVSNDGATPMNVQVRIFRWIQVDGVDQLTLTTDMVVSPPVTTVPDHSSQIIRIIRVKKEPVENEENYRIIVDELPNVNSPNNGQVVALLMRHSIPVFFEPVTPAVSATNWRWETKDGGPMLVVNNNGARHQRVANVVIRDASGSVIGSRKGLFGYVLAHATARWPCPTTSPGQVKPTRVTADTDRGPLDASIAPPTP